jgi:hypothetical protein
MPRKRLPILQKLSNLLKVSIFVAKMRKPIIPKLIFLKKARRPKKFRLLKRYPYGFHEEYHSFNLEDYLREGHEEAVCSLIIWGCPKLGPKISLAFVPRDILMRKFEFDFQ